jgi:hypothetical protein
MLGSDEDSDISIYELSNLPAAAAGESMQKKAHKETHKKVEMKKKPHRPKEGLNNSKNTLQDKSES